MLIYTNIQISNGNIDLTVHDLVQVSTIPSSNKGNDALAIK